MERTTTIIQVSLQSADDTSCIDKHFYSLMAGGLIITGGIITGVICGLGFCASYPPVTGINPQAQANMYSYPSLSLYNCTKSLNQDDGTLSNIETICTLSPTNMWSARIHNPGNYNDFLYVQFARVILIALNNIYDVVGPIVLDPNPCYTNLVSNSCYNKSKDSTCQNIINIAEFYRDTLFKNLTISLNTTLSPLFIYDEPTHIIKANPYINAYDLTCNSSSNCVIGDLLGSINSSFCESINDNA